MTKAQKCMITKLMDAIKNVDFYGDKDEVKKFETEENELGGVWVTVVTGMKNDEGTIAECLCRKYRHIYIGKNGGLTSYTNSKKNNKGAALHKFSDVVIYGYRD